MMQSVSPSPLPSPPPPLFILMCSWNDIHNVQPPLANPERRQFERLVRKVLDYPSRPAVLLLHVWTWHQTSPVKVCVPVPRVAGCLECLISALGVYWNDRC